MKIDGYTREAFIAFLEGTLIPDLKASGTVETAKDFETAVAFMRDEDRPSSKKKREPKK